MRNLLVLCLLLFSVQAHSAQISAKYIESAFNTLFGGKITDDLDEGSTNFYFTDTRFNTAFGTKTTSDLAEGTNKYYTATAARGDLLATSITDGDTTHAPDGNAVYDALALKINSSEKGAALGVVPLNASSKIDVAYLPNGVMQYKGAWSAASNTPTLADGTGTAGDVYRVSAAGTQDLGSGSHTYAIADFVIYNGSIWQYSPAADGVVSVNSQTGVVTLDTDDISEGSVNKYFSNTLARGAVSATTGSGLTYNNSTGEFGCTSASASDKGCLTSTDWSTFNGKQNALSFGDLSTTTTGVTITGGTNAVIGLGASVEIDTADATHSGLLSSSDWSRFDAAAAVPFKQTITLVSGDITNQYVDMSQECKADSLVLILKGASAIAQSLDYTVSVVSSKTRITFAGDLASAGATPLIAGDVFYAQCIK